MTADWLQPAACRGADTDLFYPPPNVTWNRAAAICAQCPVTAQCLAHAKRLGVRHGIWGGRDMAAESRSGRVDPVRLCQRCGELFTPRHWPQVYCTGECRDRKQAEDDRFRKRNSR